MINLIQITRNGEIYQFSYAPGTEIELMQIIGRWASNPELSFTWWDAAIVSKEVAKYKKKQDVRHGSR